MYRAAFERVKSVLSTKPLLPTSSGDYESSKNTILVREKVLSDLLNTEDCKKLFDREHWLSTEITSDRTKALKNYLMSELGIPEIYMEKFCTGLNNAEFIKTKSDEWLVDFYSNVKSDQARKILSKRLIIRLEDDSHVCPENFSGEPQVYLPSPTGKSKFKTIKEALVTEESKEFLEKLGLKEPGDIEEIREFIIPKYQGQDIDIDEEEYIEDFDRVLAIWQNADKYKKAKLTDLLKEARFIRCVNQQRDIEYQRPSEVYFRTEALTQWFKGNTRETIYFLPSSLELSEEEKEASRKFGA